MTVDVEVLSELYLTMKEYVLSKDRQAAADNVMSTVVDMLDDRDLKEFASTDKFLSKAAEEYLGDADDLDEEDSYDYDDDCYL